jgi:hypothetical protein
MKILRFFSFSFFLLALGGTISARGQIITLDVSALIDGRDQLIIHRNMLQWHHFDWAAVGRYGGANEPTVITTTLNGVTVMNHVNWTPVWPAPPPDEIRYEAFSDVFTQLTPSIPRGAIVLQIDPVIARGGLGIAQLPTAANDFTTILEFTDDPNAAASYEGRLTFQVIPEPSVLSLVTSGGLALLLWRVRRPARACRAASPTLRG